MSRREQGNIGVLEVVVQGEGEADSFGATEVAAFTNELPIRDVMRGKAAREVADPLIDLSKRLPHDTLPKSRLA
jgi:hypothetical protein